MAAQRKEFSHGKNNISAKIREANYSLHGLFASLFNSPENLIFSERTA